MIDPLEETLASGEGRPMQEFGARVIRGRAWPLQPLGVDASIANPCIRRRQRGHLVKNLLSGVIVHGIARFAAHSHNRLPVGLSGQRFDGLAHALDAPFGIGECSVGFGEAGRREHHIRKFCCFRKEEFLHHQELQLVQTGFDVVGVGIGQHRVFTEYIHGLKLPGVGLIEHLRNHEADLVRHGSAPGLLEFFSYRGVGNLLVAGEDIGEGSHIAGALYIILPA